MIFDAHASLDANGSQVLGRRSGSPKPEPSSCAPSLDHLNRVAESNEGNNAIRSDQNVVVSP